MIRGTRIAGVDILEYPVDGMPQEELLVDFPDREEAELRAALAFAAERKRRLFSTS